MQRERACLAVVIEDAHYLDSGTDCSAHPTRQVVVIEDAHYLDSASAELAKQVAHACKHLLLILAYRNLTPAEAANNPVLADALRDLAEADGTQLVHCGPLRQDRLGLNINSSCTAARSGKTDIGPTYRCNVCYVPPGLAPPPRPISLPGHNEHMSPRLSSPSPFPQRGANRRAAARSHRAGPHSGRRNRGGMPIVAPPFPRFFAWCTEHWAT